MQFSFSQVIFQAQLYETNAKIYVDDIKLSPGSCPTVTECSFDDSMCSFSQPDEADFGWLFGCGRVYNPDLIEGPEHDHTTGDGNCNLAEDEKSISFVVIFLDTFLFSGMFAYVDMTYFAETGMAGVMRTQKMKPTKVSCLEFYYVAYGPGK